MSVRHDDAARMHIAVSPWSSSWDGLWSKSWSEIETSELVPGHPFTSDIWVIPEAWASGGSRSNKGERTINFGKTIPALWPPDGAAAEAAKRRIKRLAGLMFLKTIVVGRYVVQPPQPSTWVAAAQDLIRAAKAALEHSDPDEVDRPIFADLTAEAMEAICAKHVSFARMVVHRLNALFATDAFDDWPAKDVATLRDDSVPILPLPDAFTAACGSSAIWFLETVGPDLLTCWEEIRSIDRIPGRMKPGAVRAARVEKLLSWEGKILKAGFVFRYPVMVKGAEDRKLVSEKIERWPPTSYVALRALVYHLQAAHVFVLTLCTGGRDGETVDLTRSCLVEADQDKLVGVTYKLSDRPGGEARDWPLPKIAVMAVRQQKRLADITEPSADRLLVAFDSRAQGEVKVVAFLLTGFASRMLTIDGTPLLDLSKGKINATRIRKTVVRLAALALVGANQILVDILGHRDPEMTLGYITSDPNIQNEMRTIAREASIALAKDAIVGAQGNGGPAAPAVLDMAHRLAPRGAPAELEAESLNLAAEILSMNGSVMLVRRNVLCTKSVNQYGPCTRRVGAPDAGNCQSDCGHRLELAAARADHRSAIKQILEEIPSEDGAMRTWWQGQLMCHLTPFADLRDEMLADPAVIGALRGVESDMLESFGTRIGGRLG